MKKIFLFALATVVMHFSGCQKSEQNALVNSNDDCSTFELVADILQTKTTLDAQTYEVDWEAGDKIYMVTSDGTWGAPYSDDNSAKTVAEFLYADGKFSTDATIANGEYTFKALYTDASQKSYHRGASTTHKLEATQNQNCATPTKHIKSNDALVGTFTAALPMNGTAHVNMAHLYTLMQVDVKNTTGADIEVVKFEMTAEGADLAGIFNVLAFDTPALSTKQDATSTITVNLTGGTVANNASLPIYFVMAPLAGYSGNITFKVTDSEGKTYTKTVAMTGISFEAGKYNTTPYTIKDADVVNTEATTVTWDLSKNETSEASTSKLAWDASSVSMVNSKGTAQTNANNYYPGSNNRTSTRFYSGNLLKISPKTGYAIESVVFTATSEGYATALKGSTWTNAVATVSGTVVTINPEDGCEEISASITGTCGLTKVVVKLVPSEDYVKPVIVLSSIALSGQSTSYTVGDAFSFNGTVTATYSNGATKTVSPTQVSSPDMTTIGDKEVTVTYTEEGVSVTAKYTINVADATTVDPSTPKYYVKVTTAPADWSGTYLIVAGTSAANGTITSKWLKYNTVTIANNQIESTEAVDAIAVTVLKANNGNYTIRFANNNYLGTSDANDGIKVATSVGDQFYWKFSVASSLVKIESTVKTGRILRLNGTSGFRTYTSTTGTQATLYKLQN